jgi:hypothetical protein
VVKGLLAAVANCFEPGALVEAFLGLYALVCKNQPRIAKQAWDFDMTSQSLGVFFRTASRWFPCKLRVEYLQLLDILVLDEVSAKNMYGALLHFNLMIMCIICG